MPWAAMCIRMRAYFMHVCSSTYWYPREPNSRVCGRACVRARAVRVFGGGFYTCTPYTRVRAYMTIAGTNLVTAVAGGRKGHGNRVCAVQERRHRQG